MIGYTVPQKVRLDNVDDSLGIFFRVRSVMEKKRIVVRSNDKVIYKVMKLHLAPSEMENIKLTKEQLQDCGDEIVIAVED